MFKKLSNYQVATQPKEFSLRLESDPILYKKLDSFNFTENVNPEDIEASMIKIMECFHGVGIAANQVGFNKRVIVIKPRGQEPFAMFNPEIVNTAGSKLDEEGCLSFPKLYIQVERPNQVTVKYLDKQQKECTITLSGYDAKCVLHEIDHLDGVTFTKRVSTLKLAMALKKRKLNGRTK